MICFLFFDCYYLFFMTFSFSFWGSTTKGIPQGTIPDYYTMGSIFFCITLAVEVLVIITFFYSIIFTFYRAIKNIGQPAIDEIKEMSEVEEKQSGANDLRPQQDIEGQLKREENILKEMNVKGAFYSQKPELVDIENEDDVVYNFEDDEVPAKKKNEIEEEAKQNKEESQDDESDDESGDEAEEMSETEEKIETEQDIATRTRLFKYEDAFFRFAPCSIIPIIGVNSLTCGYITVGGFMIAALSFVCFNMLQVCSAKHPGYKNIYLLPVLAMFVPFFMNHPTFE